MRLLTSLAVSGVAVLACASGAGGSITGYVRATGSIPGGSQERQQNNVRDSDLPNVSLSAFGDESLGLGTLRGTQGHLVVSSHACSGPPAGVTEPAGWANALGAVRYVEQFTLVSDVHPVGTWLTAHYRLSAGASTLSSLNNDQNAFSPSEYGSTSGSGSVTFYGPGTNSASHSGQFYAQHNWIDDDRTANGIFASLVSPQFDPNEPAKPAGTFVEGTIAVQVGGPVAIWAEASTGSSSSARTQTTALAESRIALTWGISVEGARIVSSTDGWSPPGGDGLDANSGIALLPPPNIPEPSALGLLVASALLLAQRRR